MFYTGTFAEMFNFAMLWLGAPCRPTGCILAQGYSALDWGFLCFQMGCLAEEVSLTDAYQKLTITEFCEELRALGWVETVCHTMLVDLFKFVLGMFDTKEAL